MRKLFYVLGLMVMVAMIVVSCQKNQNTVTPQTGDEFVKASNDCVKIKDGVLTYSAGHYLEGEPLETGYDIFGYNYQAHIFNGYYANAYLGRDGYPPYEGDTEAYLAENPGAENHWTWPYRDDMLVMKWNDAWLSNMDCDGDGLLDRHYGFDTYIGSGAWETNHTSGMYEGAEGEMCEWDDFYKIIAVPEDAELVDGYWVNADGVEIGEAIWGQFAIIQYVYNDPCAGYEGAQYISPDHPGFGGW
ncbi:MAG: hypothetical protein P8100_09125 [bacterium]